MTDARVLRHSASFYTSITKKAPLFGRGLRVDVSPEILWDGTL